MRRDLGQFIEDDLSVIQWDAGKGPEIGASRRTVHPVPAIDLIFFLRARGDIRPGLGAFGIRSRRWIDGINLRSARRTAEH